MDSKNAYFEVCSLAGDEGVYVEKIENNIGILNVLVKSFGPPTF